MSSSPRPENVPKLSLSRVPSIETITFTLETSVERSANCRYMEILSSRPTEVSGVVKGCGKKVGNRARWRLHSACEIAGIPLWRVTPNSRGICRGSRGWERLGAQLFIELCLEDRANSPLFLRHVYSSLASFFGQIGRYRSGATTFTRRKVSVNVVSFSDGQIEDKPEDLSAFFVSVIMLDYARRDLRKVPIETAGRDGNLRWIFSLELGEDDGILVTFSYFYKSI